MEKDIPRRPGTGSFDVERGGGHDFRQIILATSCCPMCSAASEELKGKKVKADIALPRGSPPQSNGLSLAIWDHTRLPATRHKRTRPA